jgi:hypothetical protein
MCCRAQVLALKNKFSGLLPQVQAMMGGAGNMPSEEMMMGKLEQMREVRRETKSARARARGGGGCCPGA